MKRESYRWLSAIVIPVLLLHLVLDTARQAQAAIVVPVGFTVTTFPMGIEIDGLAVASGGPYGTDLYAAVDGKVLRVNPSSGAFTTFATGLATGANRPSGMAFDSGTFGTGLLYVSQNDGSVVTISAAGVVNPFSSAGTLFSSNDLAFAPPASPFGTNLFVSNGSPGSGNISSVTSGGVNSVFAPVSSFAQVPVGLAFPPSASVFGGNLFASLANGTLVQLDPLAHVTPFASGMGLAIDLAFSVGGTFGANIYVTDPNSQSIFRVDSGGTVSTFVTGLSLTSSGFDADLAFSNNGNTLYLANGSEIVKITAASSGLGSISGRVIDPASAPVPGARVQVCPSPAGGPCFRRVTTDSQGNYSVTGLPDGQYVVTAYPPRSSCLVPASIGPLTITNGAALTGQDIQLPAAQGLPPGTSISPSRGQCFPSVDWSVPLQLATQGCAGGSASYQILQGTTVVRSGPMTEISPGQYRATIAPLRPLHSYASVQITIHCPDGSTQTRTFTLFIDPSGHVRTIFGTPVVSATVTLFQSESVTGTFSMVPDGEAIMSPANRTNPDLTDANGHFGWDVIAGFYKVRAEKAGCVAPTNPAQPYVESAVLGVPPPVTDLDLRLDCGINNVHLYLPLVRR